MLYLELSLLFSLLQQTCLQCLFLQLPFPAYLSVSVRFKHRRRNRLPIQNFKSKFVKRFFIFFYFAQHCTGLMRRPSFRLENHAAFQVITDRLNITCLFDIFQINDKRKEGTKKLKKYLKPTTLITKI